MRSEVPITNMFSAASFQFVKSIGRKSLQPTPSIDEKNNVQPYQLVVKSTKRRFIFWEKASYHPTEFQLTDVLTKDSPFETRPITNTEMTTYNRTTKLSLKGKFGADISKEIIDIELETNDSITIDIKFGQVSKIELHEPELLSEIGNRYLNMDHPYITEIRKDKNKVLCVITGVSVLDNGGTIHRCTDLEAKASVNSSLLKNSSLSGEVESDKDRDIGLPPKMPIAYNVRELNVDKHNGQLQLVLAAGCRGGFVDSIGYDEVDATSIDTDAPEAGAENKLKLDLDLQHPRQIFLPLVQLPIEQREAINKDLLQLLSVPRDLELLSQITERAEEKQQNKMTVEELEKLLVSTAEVWLRVFRFAGFTVVNGELVAPLDTSPLLPCIGEFLDAASELDDELLQLVVKCGKDTSDKLIFVLQEGIKGNSISDTDTVTCLSSDTNATKLLLELQYGIQVDKIQAPIELPYSIDEVYWIVYAIWGQA